MIKSCLLIFAVMAQIDSHAMLRAPRATMPRKVIQFRLAQRSAASAKPTPRPKLSKFLTEKSYTIPKNTIEYAQVGKQVYTQLLALKVVLHQHRQKYNSEGGISSKFPTDQDEAYDRLESTIEEFEQAFLDSEPCHLYAEFQEKKITPPAQEKLIEAVKASIKDFENKLSDPQNKL